MRRLLKAFGQYKTLKGWSKDRRCVVSLNCLTKRLEYRSWSIEAAITTPAQSDPPELSEEEMAARMAIEREKWGLKEEEARRVSGRRQAATIPQYSMVDQQSAVFESV